MSEINIGRAIVQGRKAKGITQEQLAQYMGVSKASVSKWETGQSYPDITFLPQLAAYFNISLDELMGYEPQMTKEEIRKLYYQLSEEFAKGSFTDVMNQCEEIIKKYYSCFPLLLQMSVLLINHVSLAPTPKLQKSLFEAVKELCVRIKEESGDVSLSRQANVIQALVELNLGNPAAVVDLLDGANDPPLGEEVLLASAYHLLGDGEKAKETSQVGIFSHLMGLLGTIPNYLMLNTDDYAKYDVIMERTLGLIELFDVKACHPAVLFGIYLTGAQGYAMLGDNEKALRILEEYAALAMADVFPLEFTGDSFFDRVHNWFEELDLGVRPPRSDAVIQGSIVESVTKNPAFLGLNQDLRFQNLVMKLETYFRNQR